MPFQRQVYFDAVRKAPFGGSLTQQQVDGQSHLLDVWEADYGEEDVRWLAYALATSMHETASKLWPIEEYGKGSGRPYGVADPETGQTYYGRGHVQLTWRENYAKAANKLGLTGDDDLEWHAGRALDPDIASEVMFEGMIDGWFRSDSKGPHTLGRYFSATVDDPVGARNIINGDKSTIPSWSNGKTIGQLVAGYHQSFLAALKAAHTTAPEPPPEPEEEVPVSVVFEVSGGGSRVHIAVDGPADLAVMVEVNGQLV